MIKMVIFDLDGTLVNTLGGIAGACNHILKVRDYETYPINQYMELVGNGLAMTIFRALPDFKKEELLASTSHYISDNTNDKVVSHHLDIQNLKGEPNFNIPELKDIINELLEYYKLNPTLDSFLYDGVEEVLSYLDLNDIKWGIHTNKTESIAKDVANAFIDPSRYLGLKGPCDDVPRKPNTKGSLDLMSKVDGIDISQVIYVGDTEVDIKTARNLGVPVIAVAYGFRKKEVLEDLMPDFIVDKPKQIIDIIEELNEERL